VGHHVTFPPLTRRAVLSYWVRGRPSRGQFCAAHAGADCLAAFRARTARSAARRTGWGSECLPGVRVFRRASAPQRPQLLEMRVHPVRGVRFIPPSLFVNRVLVRRAGRGHFLARRPWPVVTQGPGRCAGQMAQRSVAQPRGWPFLTGPSRQCGPLAPPDWKGDWGTGRHLPLKAAPREARGCPVLDLVPALTQRGPVPWGN
jgi:hypothetical protein